ncbi:MAG TPA: hypothetical protein VMF32_21035 [Xanthobacteraceae bacterium]|nr:hypothetical protein [Xanthobacteraceae bacterium]
MRETIAVITQMQSDGIIARYAIGGAVATFLYIDVSVTEDLDILVSLDDHTGKSGLITLQPIFQYLKEKGFTEFRKEGIVVHGWPVQFIPVSSDLDREGLQEAIETELPVGPNLTVKCLVLRAEHLMAKALEVGRPKDHVRLTQFIDASRYDAKYLCSVLDRHGLMEKWTAFCNKFDVSDPCSGLQP